MATRSWCTAVTLLALATPARAELDCDHSEQYERTEVGGALFNHLAVDTAIMPMWQVGRTLANDQVHMLRMADDAGLAVLDKHVPAYVIFNEVGEVVTVHSGGFYTCATVQDCQGYLDQVIPAYAIGGVAFGDRPEFHHSFEGHAYEVLGAAAFQPPAASYAIRITRWHAPKWNPRGYLVQRWRNHAREEACRRGTVAQAYLLWSESERVVAEVTIGTFVDAPPPVPYFVFTLGALAAQPPLDPLLDTLPLERLAPAVTDTYLVLTYWPGAFEPSRWPNSASQTPAGPLPEPFCGDGSCNTTQTHPEDALACPVDCAPGCGDGACAADEAPETCAVDCRP